MKYFAFNPKPAADIPASIVVFLVALPLCLGVAVASDANPVTGIIAGMIGGIVVGALSGSALSVSGPAAGLTAIVAVAIAKLNSYEVFLLSVIIAGILQIIMGYLKAGIIGDYIPNAVIKGMLAAIGLILILKQLPHLVGYDADPIGMESFQYKNQQNTFSALVNAVEFISPMAILIGFVSLIILIIYENRKWKKSRFVKILPGPLLVVMTGILMNLYALNSNPAIALQGQHLVELPVFEKPMTFFWSLPRPNLAGLSNPQVWITALTLSIVASLESLLSIEAIDKLDPEKRITPTNRELKAQGVGNIVSGLLGGLPVTSVIVRSSANVNAGAQSKLSTILHGILLMLSILFIPELLNMIPKASLAAILIFTGYKLANLSLFKEHYRKGWDQFMPFAITIAAILFTDLLIGIIIGIATGFIFVLKSNFHTAIFVMKDEHRYLLRFRKEVSFLNKGHIKSILENIPNDTALLIDATKSEFIDKDIIDMINDFIVNAETRGIRVYIKRDGKEKKEFFTDIQNRSIE